MREDKTKREKKDRKRTKIIKVKFEMSRDEKAREERR